MFFKPKIVKSIFINEIIFDFEVSTKLVAIISAFAPDIYYL
jgi:hypothetical protein